MKDILILDALPYVNDRMIHNKTNKRGSTFDVGLPVQLTGNTLFGNANKHFSTIIPSSIIYNNFDDVADFSNSPLNWTSNNTSSRSIRIDLSGYVLQPGDAALIEYSVALPAGLNIGDLGCNNFVVSVTPTSDNQPLLPLESDLACVKINTEPCIKCKTAFAPIPGRWYLFSAWVKETTSDKETLTYANSNGPRVIVSFPYINQVLPALYPSGPIIDGWQRIQEKIQIPAHASDMTIELIYNGGFAAFFDDVRVFPQDGNMQSYVYDYKTGRLMAKLDEENYAARYQYDNEGRLIRVLADTEEGVRMIQESNMSRPKRN